MTQLSNEIFLKRWTDRDIFKEILEKKKKKK